MSKKVPKGWTDYLPYGDKVEGTKLFPFKTPLKLEMQNNIPKVQRFTPACLIANRPNLRAVIDLTDTDARADRYYCPKDFRDANVEHLKLRISGGGVIPGMDKIKRFSDAVDGFMRKFSDDPDALIGVHCTHGLNRTGYFICMYMVTRMGFSPIEAIDNFQKARGYIMYRQNFLEEIMEPGKHTSGPQVPAYGGQNKTISVIGNYHYQNTWLVDRPNKKPFKGFTESEIRKGGRQKRRSREDRGGRNDIRQNWHEGNEPSGIPRERSFERDPRREDLPPCVPPEKRWERGPPLETNEPTGPHPFGFARKREHYSSMGPSSSEGPHTEREWKRNRPLRRNVPTGSHPPRCDANAEYSFPMGPFPVERPYTDHGFSSIGERFPMVPPLSQDRRGVPLESSEVMPRFPLDERSRFGCPPATHFPQQRGPYVPPRGRRVEPPSCRGNARESVEHPCDKRKHQNEKDRMEYRSPLEDDGFQTPSYHRHRGNKRRGGRR